MVKLIKRGDTYKPAKLKASIMKAGASSTVAKSIVDFIHVTNGMTTLKLRKLVQAKLAKFDSKALKRYSEHKKKR